MKNLLKDKETFEKLSKSEILDVITKYCEELEGLSDRTVYTRESFSDASWDRKIAYEIGSLHTLKKIKEFINLNDRK